MDDYGNKVLDELQSWREAMEAPPSLFESAAKATQTRINELIPDRIHRVITSAIKQMTRAVILGAELTSSQEERKENFSDIEEQVREKINFYSSTAAAEGAITGYGGFFLALTDLPLWMSVKIKMLFDVAMLYGYDIKDYKERLFILHIFQLTFSRQSQRNRIYKIIDQWDKNKKKLPSDLHKFDWRTFQLDYRDYLDLAKILQLIPGFGAIVGFYVNQRLTKKLGENAMFSYRLRKFKREKWIK